LRLAGPATLPVTWRIVPGPFVLSGSYPWFSEFSVFSPLPSF
jgi:hypothetical protein